MNVMLTNLMIPAPAAAPSGKVSAKPKHFASGQAGKTANPEARPAQAGKSARKAANSKDAPDTAKKSKTQSGPKAADGKAGKVKKGVNPVVTEVPGLKVFAEIIQTTMTSGKVRPIVGGESTTKALTKGIAGRPDVVLAGKTQAGKGDSVSLQVRASILGKTQGVPSTHKPVTEGRAGIASEVGVKSIGEMPLDTEPAVLYREPVKITEALAEAVSSGIGAEKSGESQVGLEVPEVNQQVLTSPARPVLSTLAEGMKQVDDAIRRPAPATGNKSVLAASVDGRKAVSATGRKAVSATGQKAVLAKGLVPEAAAEPTARMGVRIKFDTYLQVSGKSAGAVGRQQPGQGETAQDILQQTNVATDAPRFDAVDVPTVSTKNSLPASATNQIVEALRASADRGGQQVVIRLNPPELGKVSITLNANGDEVRGVLRVDNPQTLTQLQREAPALLGRLAEAGVQLKQMDLSLSEQGTNDSSLHSQLRDESSLWRRNDQDDNPQTSASEFAPDESVLAGVEEILPRAARFTDGAINVWI